ncbi:hypothetical protein HDV05_002552 [Chytridiales sp. JEL 0842]|nr:hypothetical protein HDV05_002552 [Chytridiales sp. JEL 0842]
MQRLNVPATPDLLARSDPEIVSQLAKAELHEWTPMVVGPMGDLFRSWVAHNKTAQIHGVVMGDNKKDYDESSNCPSHGEQSALDQQQDMDATPPSSQAVRARLALEQQEQDMLRSLERVQDAAKSLADLEESQLERGTQSARADDVLRTAQDKVVEVLKPLMKLETMTDLGLLEKAIDVVDLLATISDNSTIYILLSCLNLDFETCQPAKGHLILLLLYGKFDTANKSPPTRKILSAATTTFKNHSEAIIQGLLVPLILFNISSSPVAELGQSKAEAITRILKEGSGSAGNVFLRNLATHPLFTSIGPRPDQPGRDSAGSGIIKRLQWTESTCSILQALLGLKKPGLDSTGYEDVITILDVFEPECKQKSKKFAMLIMSTLNAIKGAKVKLSSSSISTLRSLGDGTETSFKTQILSAVSKL